MTPVLTVGVDVGGTKLDIGLVNPRGRVLASRRSDSGFGLSPDRFVAEVATRIGDMRASAGPGRIGAIGVGVAGQVDPVTGVVLGSPNLGWSNVALRDMLERALDTPVFLINDVQAATWAEWRLGAGRGVSDLACVFVGTGVGGGIVARGRLLMGTAGSAGEFGHTVLDYRGPPCRCGSNGCLEAHVGGWAIAMKAKQAVAAELEAGRTMLALVEGRPEALTAQTLATAAHGGDPLARRLAVEVGDALGAGLASVANAFNPQMIVLGGGVVEGLPELIEMARKVVWERALGSAKASLRVERSQLGSHAGMVGAALLARRLKEGRE